MAELRGVVPMLVTPMREDGAPDLGSLRRLVEHQIGQGSHGLAVLGLAGEGTLLTPSERQSVAETLIDAVSGRVPVLVGITAETAAEAIVLGIHAREAGATAVMLAPSAASAASRDELREHFLAVARAVCCPLMIQDAPSFLGVHLGIDLVLELNRASEWIRSYKAEALPFWPNVRSAVGASRGRLPVFGGHGGLYAIDVLEGGGSGLIPGCDATRALVQIWDTYQAGNVGEARTRYARLLPYLVFEAQSLALLIGGAKHRLRAAGVIDTAASRFPGADISGAVADRLDEYAAWCDVG